MTPEERSDRMRKARAKRTMLEEQRKQEAQNHGALSVDETDTTPTAE